MNTIKEIIIRPNYKKLGSIGFSSPNKMLFVADDVQKYHTKKMFKVLDENGKLVISIDRIKGGVKLSCISGPNVEILYRGFIKHKRYYYIQDTEYSEICHNEKKFTEYIIGPFKYRLIHKSLEMQCSIDEQSLILQNIGIGYYLREKSTAT